MMDKHDYLIALEKLRQAELQKQLAFVNRSSHGETYFPTEGEKAEFTAAKGSHEYLLEEIRKAGEFPEHEDCQARYDEIQKRVHGWVNIPHIGTIDIDEKKKGE